MPSRRQRFQFEISNPHALDSLHRMACLKQAVPQFVVPRVGKRHLIPRRALAPQSFNLGAGVTRQFRNLSKREQRLQFQEIRLGQAVRFQDSIRQIAIVR